MSDFDSEGFFENDWDECGDLAWNEFDWERYLREQDDLVHRYLAYYERLKGRPDRVDEAAHLMGWDAGQWGTESDDSGETSAPEPQPPESETADRHSPLEPYTLHKNPVFVATKAIYLSLTRSWERLAADSSKVPQPVAVAMQASLHRGEQHAVLGVQALDLGDYAMAVSLFKRALEELNRTLALADEAKAGRCLIAWRTDAIPWIFDLREIWLRVISECRRELGRRVDDES